MQVFRRSDVAFVSTTLFCVNPAGVFFSAVYTERLDSVAATAGRCLGSKPRWARFVKGASRKVVMVGRGGGLLCECSLFALLSFLGMLALVASESSSLSSSFDALPWYLHATPPVLRWLAALCFAAATATRSNGVTLMWFIVADALYRMIRVRRGWNGEYTALSHQ